MKYILRCLKKFYKIFVLIFILSCANTMPAFSENDDDICISIDSFYLNLGWGLTYTPKNIDKNQTIFPLLKFVEEHYEELSKSKHEYLAWIENSNDKNFPYRMQIIDNAAEKPKTRSFRLKKEETCIYILMKILSEEICGEEKISIKEEPLSLYLVAEKIDRDSNKPCWNGEFYRHSLSYRISGDYYIYALYFSYDKAVEKNMSEKDSTIKKLDFTKETINNIQIDFDGKLEDILSGPIWKSIRENNRIFMGRYDLHLQGCIN